MIGLTLAMFIAASPFHSTAQPPAASTQGTPRVARVPQDQAFAPFQQTPQEAAQIDRILKAWEQQSSGTKTLQATFHQYRYDLSGAPAGVHAVASLGEVKYAAPDRGLFRVDEKVFYSGMSDDGQPQYKGQEGQYGDYWVCNGKEVIEYDRTKKECRIEALPAEMQGKAIINSPLPFVFNLKAAEIQRRFWVRQVKAPKEGLLMIEAWPKTQKDAAQYRLVAVALQRDTFLPAGLVMYDPNFDPVKQPSRDIYEFKNVKRNGVTQSMQMFLRNFIPQKPPKDWKVFRSNFLANGNDQPVRR